MRSQSTKKSIERGLHYFTSTIHIYDQFRTSVRKITDVANWMVVISAVTFICSIAYFSKFFLISGSIQYQLIPLSVIFFGISAAIFSIFRGMLYFIQGLVQKSMDSVRKISKKRIYSINDRAVHRYTKDIYGSLSQSVGLWWEAHRLTIITVFILIPGFLFYILGLASLLAHAFDLILSSL